MYRDPLAGDCETTSCRGATPYEGDECIASGGGTANRFINLVEGFETVYREKTPRESRECDTAPSKATIKC